MESAQSQINQLPPRKKKSLVTILLIVLILISSAIAAFLAYQNQQLQKQLHQANQDQSQNQTNTPTPTPNPTANWKTYNNTTYGYSVRYPSNWKINTKGGIDSKISEALYLLSPCEYESGQLCSQILINVTNSDTEKKFEPSFILSPKDKISNEIITRISGEEARCFEYFQANYADHGRLLYVLVINHNDTKYTTTYEESQKNHRFLSGSDWKNKQAFDQILSTFKFID